MLFWMYHYLFEKVFLLTSEKFSSVYKVQIFHFLQCLPGKDLSDKNGSILEEPYPKRDVEFVLKPLEKQATHQGLVNNRVNRTENI